VTHEGESSKSMEESSAIHLWHDKFERWETKSMKDWKRRRQILLKCWKEILKFYL
jgi:hypothetical protein